MANQHLTDHLTQGQGPFKPPSRTEHDALLREHDRLLAAYETCADSRERLFAERERLQQRVQALEARLARIGRFAGLDN